MSQVNIHENKGGAVGVEAAVDLGGVGLGDLALGQMGLAFA